MAALLVEKDLWDVIDGSESCPAGSDNSKAVRVFIKKQQLSHAKIILHVDKSQLAHTRYDNPKDIWDSLEQVHRARGFATRLALRRQFLYMTKRSDQAMSDWISGVKNAAFQLEAAGVAVIDEDIILALTAGLPEEYSTFIVTLNGIPPGELTLPNIVTRLLNEEVQQDPTRVGKLESERYAEAGLAATTLQKGRPVELITCYNCDGKGHYQSKCPLPKRIRGASADEGEEHGEEHGLFVF